MFKTHSLHTVTATVTFTLLQQSLIAFFLITLDFWPSTIIVIVKFFY